MKKKLVYIFVILIAIILQTSVFPPVFGNVGDAVLALVLAGTVLDGFAAFLGWAILIGILYDLAAYSVIGTHVLIFLPIIYFVSFFSRRFSTDLKGIGLFLFIAFVIVATLVSRGVFSFITARELETLHGFWKNFGSLHFIGLSIICNEILFFLWFAVLKKIKKFFEIK